MKINKKATILSIVVAVIAVTVVLLWSNRQAKPYEDDIEPSQLTKKDSPKKPSGSSGISSAPSIGKVVSHSDGNDGTSEGNADSNVAEDAENEEKTEEEKLVDAFDAETDKWMETEGAQPPTMKDVDDFVAKFRKIPKDRKEECLHRALNLIPDENVMLLAGILMDKGEDKDLIELVYNDVLNRDENVKKPILQQIFKDKTHPCWADTAWILDVTGEMPKK